MIAAEPRAVTPVVNIITRNYNWKGFWGGGGGEGGIHPYISCIGSVENRYTLCPFCSGIAHGQLRELRECMNVLIVSIPNE